MKTIENVFKFVHIVNYQRIYNIQCVHVNYVQKMNSLLVNYVYTLKIVYISQ